MPNLTVEDVDRLISSNKIADLHFGTTKSLSLDDLLHVIDGRHLRTVTHPELYQYSLTCIDRAKKTLEVSRKWFPSGVQSAFPLVQMIFLKRKLYDNKTEGARL